jgi:2-oxoglutarate ferredoxin oxidoreductase subunit delta
MNNKIIIDEAYCKGCGLCIDACPKSLLRMCQQLNRSGVFPAEITAEAMSECTACTLCAQICPDVAISVYRDSS